ncbi:hypothetical protein SFC65_24115 [Priestia filamentosa]|uniref:hypothetical protein n=1 Tax=Priestia filamentosa TaxID=1402861 RepID=UPI0039825235
MLKKEFIQGIITSILIVIIAYFLDEWRYVYYVCGWTGLIHLVLSIAYLLDGKILGSGKSATNEDKERNRKLMYKSKRFFSMAIPILITALICIIVAYLKTTTI